MADSPGSDYPRATSLACVAGALVMAVAMALRALSSLGFGRIQLRRAIPHGLRLGLGVIAFIVGLHRETGPPVTTGCGDTIWHGLWHAIAQGAGRS